MDLDWLKELAEQSNDAELKRLEQQRIEKLHKRQLALSTTPHMEKIYLVISRFCEEFNRHIHYQPLKIAVSGLHKKVKGTANAHDEELAYAEESCHFSFTRGEWTFGVRGLNGEIEFVETANAASGMRVSLDEAGSTPTRKLVAYLDNGTKRVVWKRDGLELNNESTIALLREFFVDFIERTNSQPEDSD